MRLPSVTPSQCSPTVRDTLAGLPDLGLFRVLAHAETAFAPWLAYSGVLLSQLCLDPGLRELAILQVAHAERCEYEWVQHTAIGAQAGVTAQQINAIKTGQLDGPALNHSESLVVHAAHEFVHSGQIGPTLVSELLRTLGPRPTVELMLILGQYLGIARLVASLAIPVDEHALLAEAGTRGHSS